MTALTNYISIERELSDSLYLIEQIKQDGWITPDTILINCVPEYSSRLVQLLNHKLSHLNNDSLFEVVNLLLPPSNGNQVWDAPNVFLTEGSCMVSYNCWNRSLTYIALTARAASHARSEEKKENY